MKRVVMIGNFPPPIGGAAMVNAAVHDTLVAAGVVVTRIDVSAASLAHNRSLGYHLHRGARNVRGASRARRAGTTDATLYIVPDAGLGAWYTAGHMKAAARRFGAVVVHHHSCRYIDHQSRPIAILTAAARDITTHIFLTDGMAAAFQRRYGAVRYRVATNARFVTEEAAHTAPIAADGPLRLGHLSNLCTDKGFFAVADAYQALRKRGTSATLALAGPILEPAVEARIADLRREFGDDIRYHGPLHGDTKRAFYHDLDLFVFPTQFAQEAAPLVLYEALAAGVPVVSRDRGVIAEIIPAFAGAVCDRDGPFTDCILRWIDAHDWSESGRRNRSDAIKSDMRARCDASIHEYAQLLGLLGGGAVGDKGHLHV